MKKQGLLILACMLLSIGACTSLKWEKKAMAESTKASPQRMEEWNEWKFGLFIHWGPWSQAHRGPIWDMMRKYTLEEMKEAFELYKTFNPVKYNPRQWAKLAKKAGMRYVVFVTKHHDGFCNYDTKQTYLRITSPDCPYSKMPNPDLTAELVKAFRAEGFAIGLYFSHIDWNHPDGIWQKAHKYRVDNFISKFPECWKTFVRFEREQVRELLSNYGKIDILWFDIAWPDEGLPDIIPVVKMARELQPDIIINNRGTGVFDKKPKKNRNMFIQDKISYADFVTPEQYIPSEPPQGYWETNMTVSGTKPGWSGFWYKGPQATYKSSEEVVRKLADIAAKGGNFLLNIGPKPDGTLAQGEIDCLLGVGKWMDDNGEAIYGTKRSPWGTVPSWGRITRKGQRLYLIVFDWPKDGGTLPLKLKKKKIAKAVLLKDGTAVSFKADDAGDGVEFILPAEAPGEYASVIAVDFKGELDVTSHRPQKRDKKKD